MRLRSLLLLLLSVALGGGTMMVARAWLSAQQSASMAEAAPAPPPKMVKSVLIAKVSLQRGHILKPEDLVWQQWPDGRLDPAYIQQGTRNPEAFAGWVARNPIAPGEPLTEGKIVAPGNRGFLAAVLRPGMRAISVPVTVTTGISGFIFPGDSIDLLITYGVPSAARTGGKEQNGNAQYEHKASETVLRDVRVIAIDQRLETKLGEAVVAHTATLEVTPKQSEIIALASEIGKLSLSLRSLVPDENQPETAAVAASDSAQPAGMATEASVTLDSEVSPLLPRAATSRDNRDDGSVTILRGGGKGGDSAAPQPASRGS